MLLTETTSHGILLSKQTHMYTCTHTIMYTTEGWEGGSRSCYPMTCQQPRSVNCLVSQTRDWWNAKRKWNKAN